MCSQNDDPTQYDRPIPRPPAALAVAGSGSGTFRYVIVYEVEATTYLDAVTKAGTMLRTDVRLLGIHKAVPSTPGWWRVSLDVSED